MRASVHHYSHSRAEDLDLDELQEANTQLEVHIAEVSGRLDAVHAAFDELARDCERVRTSLPTQRYGTYKRALRELLDEAIASVAPLLALQKPQTPQSQVLTVTAPLTVAVPSAGAATSAPSAAVPRSATSMSLAKTTQTAKQDVSKAEIAATTAATTAGAAAAGAGDRERLVKQESVSTTDSAGSCRRPDGSEKAPMSKQNTLSKLEAVLRKQPTLTLLDAVSIAASASAVAASSGTPRSQKQEKENRSSVLSVLKRQSNLCHSETQLRNPSPTSTPGPEVSACSPLAQQDSLTSSQSHESQQKQRLTLQLGLFSRQESIGSGAQSVAASAAGWVRGSTPTTATTASGTCSPPFEAKTGLFGLGGARRAPAAVQPDSSASTPTFERR